MRTTLREGDTFPIRDGYRLRYIGNRDAVLEHATTTRSGVKWSLDKPKPKSTIHLEPIQVEAWEAWNTVKNDTGGSRVAHIH